MIHGRETEYRSKWRSNWSTLFGTNHGSTDRIGMSQILYRSVVTAVPPSRNLVSSFGHGILETIPPFPQQYSYAYLCRSFLWYQPRAEHKPTRRPLSTGGYTRRGPLAGAGGLIKSNTHIK